MVKKAIITAVASLFFGVSSYAFVKKKEIEKFIKKLTFRIAGLENLEADFNTVKADLFLQIVNPTEQDFSLKTGILKLNKLQILDNKTGKMLAMLNLNISSISIPSKGVYNLPKLTLKIPLAFGIDTAFNLINKNKDEFLNRLGFIADFEINKIKKTIKF